MKSGRGHPVGVVGVVVYVTEGEEERSLTKEILYALEEEQLPYSTESGKFEPNDLVQMAYQAATRSIFGLGICVGQSRVILHYSKLPKKEPLFVISKSQSNVNKARLFGLNAARLIKGMPFEEI